MTKRFTYVKNNSITQYQALPIQEIGKGKAFHCQGIVDKLNKLSDENEQLKQFKEKVLELLDKKIKHYEHKPFSAPVGQPMSVNFDVDVDRLARLSELQELKKELKGDVE